MLYVCSKGGWLDQTSYKKGPVARFPQRFIFAWDSSGHPVTGSTVMFWNLLE